MKRWAAVLFLIMMASSAQSQQTVVRLGIDEWSPYFSKNFKHDGVGARIVTEAFATQGVRVEFVYRPWTRCMEEAHQGKLNGTPGWARTAVREQKFFISEPIFYNTVVIFHRKDRPFDWDDLQDLSDKTISGAANFVYSQAVTDAEQTGIITINRAPDEKSNLLKVLKGRVDLAFNDLDHGLHIIQTELSARQADALTYHPKPVVKAPAHLLLSKSQPQNQQLIEIFNRGLAELQSRGLIEQYWQESRRGAYIKER